MLPSQFLQICSTAACQPSDKLEISCGKSDSSASVCVCGRNLQKANQKTSPYIIQPNIITCSLFACTYRFSDYTVPYMSYSQEQTSKVLHVKFIMCPILVWLSKNFCRTLFFVCSSVLPPYLYLHRQNCVFPSSVMLINNIHSAYRQIPPLNLSLLQLQFKTKNALWQKKTLPRTEETSLWQ